MSSYPPASLAASPLQASFQRSYRQLLQFLTRKTGCAEDARELTQDLWLQLQRRAPPAADNPEAYLFTMARNLALDHLRRRQLAVEHGDAWRALHPDEPQAADAPLLLAQRRVLSSVAARLQALPERTREVFLQHRVHGIGHDELAAQHGVTRSTIERDVQRAAQAVQSVLDDWHGPASAAAPGRRRLMGALLGVATLTGSGTLAWAWWREQAARWQIAVASAVGRQLQQTLPDGSRITLDAASRADVAYDRARRRVTLTRGAAFFDVVRDAGRPFVVEALHLRVTVLGTRFSVDLREGGPRGTEVEVAVESGRVRVESRAAGTWAGVDLLPGDTLRSLPEGAPRVQPGAGARVAGWRDGWLGFRDAPLGQVVQRLQRYTGQPIVATPGAARLPVTAEIRIAQAGEWLQALPRAMPLRVRSGNASWSISLRDER